MHATHAGSSPSAHARSVVDLIGLAIRIALSASLERAQVLRDLHVAAEVGDGTEGKVSHDAIAVFNEISVVAQKISNNFQDSDDIQLLDVLEDLKRFYELVN